MGQFAEFSAYVESSHARLLRVAVLLAGDAGDGEDLLQSVYAGMWPHWRAVRGGDPDAYARRALSNAAVSRWRRRRRETLTDAVPDRPGPACGTDRPEDWQLLAAALRALPAPQRVVVVLRYYADQSEQQVALALGLPLGTVKSHAHRGLAALRAALTQEVCP